MNKPPLKILYVITEAAPYAKVGGLADVGHSLPIALRKNGCDVKTVVPLYQKIARRQKLEEVVSNQRVNVGAESFRVGLSKLAEGDPDIYFVDSPSHFDREGIYMYPDDAERFIAFNKALLPMVKSLGWRPDVIHCNDWQSALIPAYLKTTLAKDEFYSGAGVVYTIHNLAYQGTFSPEFMDLAGLPWEEYCWRKMEFYGQVNIMKTGIVYSDRVNTVSRNYMEEILTEEYGEGLDGVLYEFRKKLSGIQNGIDMDFFNPETDPNLYANYSARSLDCKAENKKRLLEELGLRPSDAPLIGMVSRLTDQKGIDLLEGLPQELWERDFAFVLLGEGPEKRYDSLHNMQKSRPDRVSVNLKFDAKLARRIYAASDIFAMPSKFEPCGLGQLIAMRYGSIPVARATGGLADTVEDFNPDRGTGNGFLFRQYAPSAFCDGIKRALDVFPNREAWRRLQQNAMGGDFSWDASAKKYIALYEDAIKSAPAGKAGG